MKDINDEIETIGEEELLKMEIQAFKENKITELSEDAKKYMNKDKDEKNI